MGLMVKVVWCYVEQYFHVAWLKALCVLQRREECVCVCMCVVARVKVRCGTVCVFFIHQKGQLMEISYGSS